MTENWTKAIAQTSDVIGQMLVDTAEGKQTYSYEEIARAALNAGISAVLRDGPSQSRVEEAATAIFEKLHDQKGKKWTYLPNAASDFWTDIAQASTAASDRQFEAEARNLLAVQKFAD